MKFKQFYDSLKEEITDVVYHATSIESANRILQIDKFQLSDSMNDFRDNDINSKQGKGMLYYLSTTRSAHSPYIGDLKNMKDSTVADVIFKIDGRRLGQKHRAKAVDYGRGKYEDDYGNELEDRVFSKKSVIDKASKYIQEIHVWAKGNAESQIETLIMHAKRHTIPIWVYDDKKSWQNLNKRSAVESQ